MSKIFEELKQQASSMEDAILEKQRELEGRRLDIPIKRQELRDVKRELQMMQGELADVKKALTAALPRTTKLRSSSISYDIVNVLKNTPNSLSSLELLERLKTYKEKSIRAKLSWLRKANFIDRVNGKWILIQQETSGVTFDLSEGDGLGVRLKGES